MDGKHVLVRRVLQHALNSLVPPRSEARVGQMSGSEKIVNQLLTGFPKENDLMWKTRQK